VNKPTDISEFYTVSEKYYGQLHRLLIKKQSDYGPANIANAPGGALNGIRVRMFDKIARINNLIDSEKDPENESLNDSFIDLANYSIIALMILDGVWPNPQTWKHE
jgi:hypothetical protein